MDQSTELSSAEHAPAASATSPRQFVTFLVDDELFGVPMSSIREIIRMPEVVQVPLSPPSLDGLANLRGRVLPIIDLRSCFGAGRAEHDEATRVVVADGGSLVGFVVDRVTSVMSVDEGTIDSAESIQSSIDTAFITGIVRRDREAEGRMVVLLDLEKVIESEFAALAAARALEVSRAAEGLGGGSAAHGRDSANVEEELQLVSFQVADQEYAFPIAKVQEIVQVPERFCQVPNAESHVLGVMTLRDRLLPIVSLREMFGLVSAPLEEHNRIVVLTLDEAAGPTVGIVMDRVNEVLRIPTSLMAPLPKLLSRDARGSEIEGICRLESGARLVNVLSANHMFDTQALTALVEHADGTGAFEALASGEADEESIMTAEEEEQMVVFCLADEEYGVRIEDVQEILRVAEQFTHVPRSPRFIEGLVSLRGAVLPVVDLRRRFGLECKERDERQRVMVFSFGGVRTGVIVDSVTEVLKVPFSAFEAAPPLSAEQAAAISRVANFERQQRMVLVLEARELFSDAERTELEAVA